MDVVGVVARRRAVAGVVVPADHGIPDLVVPDDVQHPEPVRVRDEPAGEAVAVVTVGAGRDAAEATRCGGEVAGAAERVLTPGGVAIARGVVGEAGLAGLLQRVQGARGQAAGRGRVLHRTALGREAAVRVARRRVGRGGRDGYAGGGTLAELVEGLLELRLAGGHLVGLRL